MKSLNSYFHSAENLCGRSTVEHDGDQYSSIKNGRLYSMHSDYVQCIEDIEEDLIMAITNISGQDLGLKALNDRVFEILTPYFSSIRTILMINEEPPSFTELFRMYRVGLTNNTTDKGKLRTDIVLSYPAFKVDKMTKLDNRISIWRVWMDKETKEVVKTEKVDTRYEGVVMRRDTKKN